MNIVNKVRVTICGKEYNLQTDETPDYIIGLAARVDKEISDLIKAKPNFGIQNAAVFVALTSLDEAKKANQSIDNIRSQIKTYVDDAAKARSAKEKLSAEVKELKAKLAALEKENKELKKSGGFGCEQLVLENTITPAVMIYAEDNAAPEESESKAPEAPEAPESKSEEAEPKAQNASSGTEEQPEKEREEKQEESTDGKAAEGSTDTGAEAKNDGSDTSDVDLTPAPRKNNGKGRKKRR